MPLLLSVALILGATLLPFGAMPASRIPPAWCVACGDLWLTDVISNVALFVPCGAALAWRAAVHEAIRTTVPGLEGRSVPRVRVAVPLFASFALSAFVEGMQYAGLPPGRSPALADILSNTTGGVLGAWGLRFVLAERGRPAAACRHLALAWTALALGVFGLTVVALQPAPGTRPAHETRAAPLVVERSPFGHVPGHGWYEGITDSATLATGDTMVTWRRGWSGPIIAQLRQPPLPLRASVWVRGTDPLGGQIPLLFLHQAGDSAAWLQLAKHGRAAELTVTRRASAWGLVFPALRVPTAFAGRPVGDPRPLGVHATVTPRRLSLATSGAVHDSVSLALTPVLGWALIQPVFEVGTALAPVAEVGWLLALLFPVGWYGVRARRGAWLPAGTGALILGALLLLPALTGVHPLRAGEWWRALGAFASGATLAMPYRASGRSKTTL
jgi:hypothetical protein